jgi:hypothetical protein
MRFICTAVLVASTLTISCSRNASDNPLRQATGSDIFEWRVAENTTGFDQPGQLPVGTMLNPLAHEVLGQEFKTHEVTEPGKSIDYGHAYGTMMFQPINLSQAVKPKSCTVSSGNSVGSGFDEKEILRQILINSSAEMTTHKAYLGLMTLESHAHDGDATLKKHSHIFITLPVDCGDKDNRMEMVTIIANFRDLIPVLKSRSVDDDTLESWTHNGLIHGPKP